MWIGQRVPGRSAPGGDYGTPWRQPISPIWSRGVLGEDTNLFIYMLEARGDLARKTKALMKRMDERGDVLLTSAVTLGEILLKPR